MNRKLEIIIYSLIVIAVAILVICAESLFVKRLNNVSNILLSVLTAGYVFLTYWILKSTRQSILEQARPYVIVSLPLDRQEVVLSISNVGNRPAFDVSIEISPSLDVLGYNKSMFEPMLAQAFLAPGQEFHNPVGLGPNILKLKPENKVFRFKIEYFDAERNHFQPKEYTIDLNSYVFDKLVITTKYFPE